MLKSMLTLPKIMLDITPKSRELPFVKKTKQKNSQLHCFVSKGAQSVTDLHLVQNLLNFH